MFTSQHPPNGDVLATRTLLVGACRCPKIDHLALHSLQRLRVSCSGQFCLPMYDTDMKTDPSLLPLAVQESIPRVAGGECSTEEGDQAAQGAVEGLSLCVHV